MAYLVPYVGSETNRRPPLPMKVIEVKPVVQKVEPAPKSKPPIDFMEVQPNPMPASLWRIMREVCKAHEVFPHELVSDSRDKRYAGARQAYVVRARLETNYSYPRIAGSMNKDHSTAIYCFQKWQYDQSVDQNVKIPRGWLRRIHKPLSAREIEFLRLEHQGVSIQQICAMWGVAPSTARTTKSAAHRKLKRDNLTVEGVING